jgi:very-short-patch-repair endonuclease
VPIGPYIVDFYCADHRLISDSDSGRPGANRDSARDQLLAARGFRVLRLRNGDVLFNLPRCLDLIATRTAQHPQPIDHPDPI